MRIRDRTDKQDSVLVESDGLRLEDVTVTYGEAVAINSLTMRLEPGRVLAVLGANGAGKTTLAKAVAGIVPIAKGRITLDGRSISRQRPYVRARAGIVYLPENRGIFPSLSVHDNLRMATRLTPGRAARRERVDRALTLFPILAQRRGQTAGTLSGGEQQMLALARVFVTDTSLVIADEPSQGLHTKVVDQLYESLRVLRCDGCTILLTEQYVDRALSLADATLIMKRGVAVWAGEAADATHAVRQAYGLGEAGEG